METPEEILAAIARDYYKLHPNSHRYVMFAVACRDGDGPCRFHENHEVPE